MPFSMISTTMHCKSIVFAALLSFASAADNEHAHGHGRELCGCAQHEADHPFTIDCADAANIRAATAKLKSCGTASSAACSVANADGVMECQAAFFVLQAHHDYCDHDTLSAEEEELVHVWEASCLQCAIERHYDSTLMDCPRVNCADATVIDAAFWIVNTTCIGAVAATEYEWGGSFETPADSYTWISQPTGDTAPYSWVDPAMKMVFIPASGATEEVLNASALPTGPGDTDTASEMMAQTTCTTVNSGETIVPSVTECFNFAFSGQADFEVIIDTTGVSHVMVFAQHVPTEFERDTHYFLSADKTTDIEPVAEVGAGAAHDHGRRLATQGKCCNTPAEIGAFKQIVAYHDLCDHDDVPHYVEMALHAHEAACAAHFCNAIDIGYDGTVCPSPPSPPVAPAPSQPVMTTSTGIEPEVVIPIVVVCVVFLVLFLGGICFLVTKEKQGKPVFKSLEAPAKAQSPADKL